MRTILYMILLSVSLLSFGETPKEETLETLPPSPEIKEEVKVPAKHTPWVGKLLGLSARLDASYTGGGAIAQGFAIPSLRVTAFGEAGEAIDYRISLSQTREYSSALIPQMIPSEAYMDLSTNPVRNGERRDTMDLRLRLGMTAPQFNPAWTPDLSELNFPDYGEVHKANFVSRDIGAELSMRTAGDSLFLAAGAFNGSGITSLNTNNSKAFSAFGRFSFLISSLKISLGNGTYFTEQSTLGAINYKKHWISDFFLSVGIEGTRTQLLVDSFISEYEDPNRIIAPNGYSVSATMGLIDWMGLFTRYEYASNSPQKGRVTAFQVGPTAALSDYAKAFLIFQKLDFAGSEERAVFLRVRVSI